MKLVAQGLSRLGRQDSPTANVYAASCSRAQYFAIIIPPDWVKEGGRHSDHQVAGGEPPDRS